MVKSISTKLVCILLGVSWCVETDATNPSPLPEDVFHPERHFSTKTGYWSQQHPSTWTAPPGYCKPVLLEGMVRHGARNPGRGDIKKLNRLTNIVQEYADELSASGHEWMTKWATRYPIGSEHILISRGEEEQYNLAKRLKEYLPELFSEKYSPNVYNFQSTQVSRTAQSAAAFVYGWFEGQGTLGEANFQPVSVWSDSLYSDNRLRFYDNCPKYLYLHGKTTKDSNVINHLKEIEKGPVIAAIAKELSTKMGIADKYTLSYKDVHGIYRACNYDTVNDGHVSPWCDFLGEKAIRIMEYRDDMKQWWQKSYPHEINYHMACPLLADIFKHVEDHIEGPLEHRRTNIRFAHAETLMPFVTMMGLFRDDYDLIHDLDYNKILNRKFSSSYTSPFTGNVMFVLYECGEGEYKIKFMLNEKEYVIPGCSDLFCPLWEAKKVLKQHLDDCQFDQICQHTPLDSGKTEL
eukprot:CFRG0635T1